MKTESDKVSQSFGALLDKEYALLKGGDITGLDELTARKEDLLEGILAGKVRFSMSDVRVLKQKISNNRDLYEALMAGVSAASARITSLRNSRDVFNVYNSNGARKSSHSVVRGIKV